MFNGIIKNTGIINRLYKKNNNCFLYILSKIKFTKKETIDFQSNITEEFL